MNVMNFWKKHFLFRTDRHTALHFSNSRQIRNEVEIDFKQQKINIFTNNLKLKNHIAIHADTNFSKSTERRNVFILWNKMMLSNGVLQIIKHIRYILENWKLTQWQSQHSIGIKSAVATATRRQSLSPVLQTHTGHTLPPAGWGFTIPKWSARAPSQRITVVRPPLRGTTAGSLTFSRSPTTNGWKRVCRTRAICKPDISISNTQWCDNFLAKTILFIFLFVVSLVFFLDCVMMLCCCCWWWGCFFSI